jgi:hypothetical protein
MGSTMIEAQETGIISSMADDIKALKIRIEELEAQLQILMDMHSEAELELREDYLADLDEIEEKGQFEDFSDFEALRRRIEAEGK